MAPRTLRKASQTFGQSREPRSWGSKGNGFERCYHFDISGIAPMERRVGGPANGRPHENAEKHAVKTVEQGVTGASGSERPSPCATFCPSLVCSRVPGQSPVLPHTKCAGSSLLAGPWGWCPLRRLRVSGSQHTGIAGAAVGAVGTFSLLVGPITPGPLVSRCEPPLRCGVRHSAADPPPSKPVRRSLPPCGVCGLWGRPPRPPPSRTRPTGLRRSECSGTPWTAVANDMSKRCVYW